MKHVGMSAEVEGNLSMEGIINYYPDGDYCLARVMIRDGELCTASVNLSFSGDVDRMLEFCKIHNVPVMDERKEGMD